MIILQEEFVSYDIGWIISWWQETPMHAIFNTLVGRSLSFSKKFRSDLPYMVTGTDLYVQNLSIEYSQGCHFRHFFEQMLERWMFMGHWRENNPEGVDMNFREEGTFIYELGTMMKEAIEKPKDRPMNETPRAEGEHIYMDLILLTNPHIYSKLAYVLEETWIDDPSRPSPLSRLAYFEVFDHDVEVEIWTPCRNSHFMFNLWVARHKTPTSTWRI